MLALMAVIPLYLKERADRIRYEGNYDTVVNDKENAEILHKGELLKYHKGLDSLAKVLGVRSKTLGSVFEVQINYKDSNLLIPVAVKYNVYDTIPVYANKYMVSKPCYDLELISINDTIREKLTLHDKLTGFLHWERPHKIWFVRWGRKQYFLKLHSECRNDTIKVNKLIIFQ